MSSYALSAIFRHLSKATVLITLASAVGLASAGIVTVNGDTTGDPTWNRTTSGVPPSGLSPVGTAVSYEVTIFHVNTSGAYTLLNTSTYDNYLNLYATAFDPTSQLTNLIAADDDSGPAQNAQLSNINLLAGVNYFAVSSGYNNNVFGPFTLSISGQGDDLAILGSVNGNDVPEPGSLALMSLALLGLTTVRNRKTL